MYKEYEQSCKKLIQQNYNSNKSFLGFPLLHTFKNTPSLKKIKVGNNIIFDEDMGLQNPAFHEGWYDSKGNLVSVANFKNNQSEIYTLSPQRFDEFTDLNFNGVTFSSLNIYRVSDGSRYNINLTPTIQDKTSEIPGADGMYLFNSFYKQKQFNISFAFDSLSDKNLRDLRILLNGKNIAPLEFSERQGYIYMAKVTGNPSIKIIPFDEVKDGTSTRIYKGEGSVQFTTYFPFSCWIQEFEIQSEKQVSNIGDLPATFLVESIDDRLIPADSLVQIGINKIIIKEACSNLKWDSKSGIVTGTVNGMNRAINVCGDTCGTIPLEGIISNNIKLPEGLTLKYYNWYY